MTTQNSLHRQLIIDFYTAFQHLDWESMAGCYHQQASFSDPLFEQLAAADTALMWKMLCDSANDFVLHFDHVQADDEFGSARWTAEYSYISGRKSPVRRRVRNEIFAQFQFEDGRISRHSDHFSFWRWSSQALGPAGLALGWSALFRRRVQHRAQQALARYRKVHGPGECLIKPVLD